MGSSFSIFKIISEGKAAGRFLAASVVSFAFSIAVILSTIGLMDGFESSLRSSLKRSSGDYQITSERGFFLAGKLAKALERFDSAPVLEMEAFAAADGANKGVLVKGVDPASFRKVAGMRMPKLEGGVVVGKELARSLHLQVGDEITLTFASDQARAQGGAILKKYAVHGIVSHGIYEKDLRFVYASRRGLAETFGYKKEAVNKVLADGGENLGFEASMEAIKALLPEGFSVEPFWAEYKTLLRAVEVEKTSISLVLQIIVIVAIFNVLAFIIFISEKKSREFFLLRAFGVSARQLASFWRALLFWMWAVSSALAAGLTYVFNVLLTRLPLFDLPGDIYVLSDLRLELGWEDYALVYALALGWVMLIGGAAMWRIKKRAVLSGLRQEFK